ncbi:acetyltransferase [Halopseudomonas sp.]|uniref:acetyltransferase n=1 Tax=Halopseudomonas sp. TaxID=2901191 RepID=UPI0030025BA9
MSETKQKDLIIVGHSGFGKEVFWLASRLGLQVRGFLDDNPEVADLTFADTPVIGGVKNWVDHHDCQFVIAIGNPRIRQKVCATMQALGTPHFATLIDPAAVVMAGHVNIGEGSVICAGTVCTVEVNIGRHVIINLNCSIGHECAFGDFVTVAPLAAVSGNVSLGEKSEVGTAASIRQGLTIGKGAMVGMGSVVTKNVSENTVVFGAPAKAIKTLED